KSDRISQLIITCDCQVEPKRNVISGSPVLQAAGARMCRTSACRAGLLLRRACRREKARVSSVHIARLPGKRETPVLCCHDLWTRVQWLIKGGMLFGYAMSVPPATFSMSSD